MPTCNLPEVPPYQAVLAVPQAPGPPVEGSRYTMEFMYHKHTDSHIFQATCFRFLLGRDVIMKTDCLFLHRAFQFVTTSQQN